MNFRSAASQVAKREGKKSEVSIGNVRETLKVMVDLSAEQMAQAQFDGTKDESILEFLLNRAEAKAPAILKRLERQAKAEAKAGG